MLEGSYILSWESVDDWTSPVPAENQQYLEPDQTITFAGTYIEGDFSCEVTYPTSGSIFSPGEEVCVTWTSDGQCGSDVNIYLIDSSSLQTLIASTTSNDGNYCFTIANDSSGSYRIMIVTSEGCVCYSDYFYINENCPDVGTPSDPDPGVGDNPITPPSKLDWSDVSGATSYEVYFGTDPSPDSGEYKGDVTVSEWQIDETLELDVKYYWKIVAKNDCGNEQSGPTWDFTYGDTVFEVNDPSSGTVWMPGDNECVTWESGASCGSTVNIFLYKGNSHEATLVIDTTNDENYCFTVPEVPAGTDYRILAVTSGMGCEDYSEYFTIENCPDVGTPSDPDPGVGDNPITPPSKLDWSDVSGATSYEVYFGTDPSPDSGEYKGDVTVSEWQIDETLELDVKYYWKIVAKNDCGNEQSGPTWDFTYGDTVFEVNDPSSGTVWMPGDNECVTWESGASCGSTVNIFLYKGNSHEATLVIDTTNDENYCFTVPEVPAGTDYRILAVTSGMGCEDYSEYFTIENCPDVGTPSDPDPGVGDNPITPPSKLDWSDVSGATSYEVYFGTDPSPDSGEYKGDVTVSEWQIDETLELDVKYYWKIVAKNDCGNEQSGPTWDFTYGDTVFEVNDPSSGTVWMPGDNECVTWESGASCGSTVNIFLYKGNSHEATLVIDTTNDENYCFTVPEVPAGTDYRILAVTSGMGCEDYSEYFTIENCPDVGTPSDPDPGVGDNPITPPSKLDWSDVSGATSYEVYFGTDPSPDSGEYKGDVTVSEWQIDETLELDVKYYWKIVAKNDCGNEQSGPTWDFTYGDTVFEVNDPSSGTVWMPGDNECVTWESGASCGSTVNIFLYKGNSHEATLVIDTTNDENYCFTVPEVPAGTDYRILAVTSGMGCEDYSEYFTIEAGECTMEVTTPNSSSVWEAGLNHRMFWNYSASCGDEVTIYLYQGSSFVAQLESHVPNDGDEWLVIPNDTPSGSNYRVLVVTNNGDAYSDYFTIE